MPDSNIVAPNWQVAAAVAEDKPALVMLDVVEAELAASPVVDDGRISLSLSHFTWVVTFVSASVACDLGHVLGATLLT
jgi:hypothetical protein